MRLIDADEFKRQIVGMAIVTGYSARKANKMCELIDKQPTVYDVDKVVERLETEDSKIEIQYEKGLLDGIGKAIEIVKEGGTDGR